MFKVVKACLKKIPLLVRLKRAIWKPSVDTGDRTSLNILLNFPLYAPYSAGAYQDKSVLTLQAINSIFPFLQHFAKMVNGRLIEIQDIQSFPKTDADRISVLELKKKLDFYGSDKANYHNYHHLYGSLLSKRETILNIFEIGLGTNNSDVVSTMGVNGRPGASLRAFRDFCPDANIYGADIDKRILFSEDRINTFYVDQTKWPTFAKLMGNIPATFDLVIDDGLHSPHANILSLMFGIQIIKNGGWVVVEDISPDAVPLWQFIGAILPLDKYMAHLFQAQGGLLFAVKKL